MKRHLPRQPFGPARSANRQDDIRKLLVNSDIIFALSDSESDELLAFSRVLTDDTYFALIFDVIVAPKLRGEGVGRLLMSSVMSHPRVACVKSVELVCQPELVSFYRKWGFTENVGRSLLMRCTGDTSLTQ